MLVLPLPLLPLLPRDFSAYRQHTGCVHSTISGGQSSTVTTLQGALTCFHELLQSAALTVRMSATFCGRSSRCAGAHSAYGTAAAPHRCAWGRGSGRQQHAAHSVPWYAGWSLLLTQVSRRPDSSSPCLHNHMRLCLTLTPARPAADDVHTRTCTCCAHS
jgi:hypothetical protein